MPCWHCSSDVAHAFPMLLPITSYFNSMLLLFHCETMWFISVSSTHHLCGIHVSSIQRLRVVYASSMYYRGISAMHPLSRHQLGIFYASSMHHPCIMWGAYEHHVRNYNLFAIYVSSTHLLCIIDVSSTYHLCIIHSSPVRHLCT